MKDLTRMSTPEVARLVDELDAEAQPILQAIDAGTSTDAMAERLQEIRAVINRATEEFVRRKKVHRIDGEFRA